MTIPVVKLVTWQQAHDLYNNHHGWLQKWLYRRLGNTLDAADIAQDVFMRVLTRRQPSQIHEPRAYLSSIARGLVVDHWRRRELEQVWLEILAVLPEPETPAPESRLIFLETLVEIDRVLDSLKPAVRTAFLLAQIDGLTCSQIAKPVRPVEASTTLWEHGMLLARDMHLGELIAELNRYHRGVLRCDPSVASLAISGAFPVTDIPASLALLETTLPIRISSTTSWWITVQAR